MNSGLLTRRNVSTRYQNLSYSFKTCRNQRLNRYRHFRCNSVTSSIHWAKNSSLFHLSSTTTIDLAQKLLCTLAWLSMAQTMLLSVISTDVLIIWIDNILRKLPHLKNWHLSCKIGGGPFHMTHTVQFHQVKSKPGCKTNANAGNRRCSQQYNSGKR